MCTFKFFLWSAQKCGSQNFKSFIATLFLLKVPFFKITLSPTLGGIVESKIN